MKRLLIVVLLCGCAAGQNSAAHPKKQPRPIVLSGWMRHVALHYLDLIDHVKQNSSDWELYHQFLKDERASVQIDARGDDAVFAGKVLDSMELLADSMSTLSLGFDRAHSKELRLVDSIYYECRIQARAIVDEGVMRIGQFDSCSASTIYKLTRKAHAEDEADRLDADVRSMLDYCGKGTFDSDTCNKFKSTDKYKTWLAGQRAPATPSAQ
jgi:hypothetical protein